MMVRWKIAAAVLLSVSLACGCSREETTILTVQEQHARIGRPDAKAQAEALSLSIELVSDFGGGLLRAGSRGLLKAEFESHDRWTLSIPLGSGYGLGGEYILPEERREPSFCESSPGYHYYGIEVADVTADWLDGNGSLIFSERLLAPETAESGPRAEFQCVTTAPPNEGSYTLRLTVDNTNVRTVERSYGRLSATPSIYGRWVAEARGVRIAPSNQAASGRAVGG